MDTETQTPGYIQDLMQENTCFGCGSENPDGLQIKSYWEGDQCICIWHSDRRYQGWENVMNGGILATVIDCHAMATAMSHAYRLENREMGSDPIYYYATGSMSLKYLKPSPNDVPLKVIARVSEVKHRKTVVQCEAWFGDLKTVESEVVAIRVYDSSQAHGHNPFVREKK